MTRASVSSTAPAAAAVGAASLCVRIAPAGVAGDHVVVSAAAATVPDRGPLPVGGA